MIDDQNPNDQSSPAIDADSLNATQGLIGRLSIQMDEYKKKKKDLTDMLKGVFDNDEKLNAAETKAKELTQDIKSRKTELNSSPQVQDIKMKLTDVAEDMKLVQESLNTHLVNYFKMTNSTVIDMPDGTEREFSLKATLKGKKNFEPTE